MQNYIQFLIISVRIAMQSTCINCRYSFHFHQHIVLLMAQTVEICQFVNLSFQVKLSSSSRKIFILDKSINSR